MVTANVKTKKADPAKATRIATVVRREDNSIKNLDFNKIIDGWTVKTNILKRIKEITGYRMFTVIVTPDMALDMLTLNDRGRNRHMRLGDLEEYVTAMKNKEWEEKTGEAIKFDVTGMLADGQHRLWAIWISKVSLEMSVVVGLGKNAFSFLDMGASRNGADVTSANGFQKYDNALAYAIKCIILFENKSLFKGGISKREVPNYKLNQWQQADKKRMERLIEDLTLIKNIWMKWNKNFFTVPQWLAIYYILRTLPNREKDARKFLEDFASGENLKPKDPIKVLRQKFENEYVQYTKYKTKKRVSMPVITMKVKSVFLAWDYWLDGATVNEILPDLKSPQIKKPGFIKKRIGN